MSFRSFIYSSKIENHRKLAAESLSKGDVASAIYNFREALKCDYTEEIYHDVLLAYAEGKLFNNVFVEAVIQVYDKHHKGASWIAKHQDRSFIIWKSTCKRLYDEGCKLLDENKYEEAEWTLYKASLLTDLSAYSLFVRNVLNGNFRKYKVERIDEDMPTEWYGFKGKLDYYKANEYFEWYKKMSVQSDEIETLKSLLLTAKEYAESAKNKSGLKSVSIFQLKTQENLLLADIEEPLSVALLKKIHDEIENCQKREAKRLHFKEMIEKAEQGDVNAQLELGIKFYKGEEVKKNYTLAAHYYKLAAEQGNQYAQNNLGLLYDRGLGVERDYSLAFHYYKLAAEQGDEIAQCNLGLLYVNGQGVVRNYALAAHYFKLSAEQGYVLAQYNLGKLYVNGYGVERDFLLAIHYYKLSAEQGHRFAQGNLALIYHNGLGVKQDYALAAHYYKLAAEQGVAGAQNNLGVLYKEGLGVEKDYRLAAHYFKLAAERGEVSAQGNLGSLYERGLGVERDYSLAAHYYKLAAEQGEADAQSNLAILYYNGQGVEKNYNLAAHYYKLAAEQGKVGAQCNLGIMYYKSQGVDKDNNKAAQWWLLAARNGSQEALHNLKVLKRDMEEDTWSYYFKSLARQMVGTIASEAVSMEIEERIDGDWGEILGDAAGDIVNEMITKENKESKDLNML